MIMFKDCELFVENDLDGNFAKLLRAAGLAGEDEVDQHIRSFTVTGVETLVGDGKRKSALFVAYLRHLLAPSEVIYMSGNPLVLSDGARDLTCRFFGDAVMNHPVPKALMAEDATVAIKTAA